MQTFLRVVTVAPGGGGGPASALRTPPSGKLPSAANAPAVRPERFRKLRRSSYPFVPLASAATTPPRARWRSDLLISTGASLPDRIRVDTVEVANLRGVGLIARLALVSEIDGSRVHWFQHHDARGRRANADNCKAKQIAPADIGLEAFLR